MTYFTNEDWFDALEDFCGPDIDMEWTPEDNKNYNAYLARRHSVATAVADPGLGKQKKTQFDWRKAWRKAEQESIEKTQLEFIESALSEQTPKDDMLLYVINRNYNDYLAKRHSVPTAVADPAELEREAKAKTFAFYTEEAIANELSPFDI